MQIIPMISDVNYEFDIQLEQTTYRFIVVWNNSGDFYTMDIQNLSTGVEFRGIKLVLNTELIGKFASSDLPNGGILVINTDQSKQRLNFEDFAGNARLIFVPQAEMEQNS